MPPVLTSGVTTGCVSQRDCTGSTQAANSRLSGFNHGSVLHFAHEEVSGAFHLGSNLDDLTVQQGLTSNSSIHAGIHSALSDPKSDQENDERCGYDIIPNRELDKIGALGVVEKIRRRVGQNSVYVSVDIDVLDPAYAPGMFKIADTYRSYEPLTECSNWHFSIWRLDYKGALDHIERSQRAGCCRRRYRGGLAFLR